MLFIEKVMKEIWKPYADVYKDKLKEYSKYDEETLKDIIKKGIDNYKYPANTNQIVRMTSMISCGCPHWRGNHALGGCSFCDFFTQTFEVFILAEALKRKNVASYAEMVRYSFQVQRGEKVNPLPIEFITVFDTMNENEFGNIVFNELFSDPPLYNQEIRTLVCETRINSITEEAVLLWKSKARDDLVIESGIEVGNEWLRNHWLNKKITDVEMYQAWDIIHKAGCSVNSDILFGIPGITERQSIELFKYTYKKLTDSNSFVVSPLLCKGNDLQSNIIKHFSEDKEMIRIGVIKKELSGMPHILSLLTAFHELFTEDETLIKKLGLAQRHFSEYYSKIIYRFRKSEYYPLVDSIIQVLTNMCLTQNIDDLRDLYDKIIRTDFYHRYLEQLSLEYGMEQLNETLHIVAKKLSNVYSNEEGFKEFEKELSDFNFQY